jgi:2-oxo-3-hexenedioate decarboxylase
MSRVEEFAKRLHEAQKNRQAIPQFKDDESFSLREAYDIQHALIKERIKEGEELIGIKMGFTSEAKMQQMGVSEMIIGQLTTGMHYQNGGAVSQSNFIHPRVEPEIYFRLSKDIISPITLENCLDYVDGVGAGLEIIDSRYENFKFSLEDVVADNCSSAAFVTGILHEPKEDLKNLSMRMEVNSEVVEEGNSNDILGNPLKSLVAASELASKYRIPLKKGMIVLAGAATPARFTNEYEEINASVESLDSVFFRTTK